MPSDLAVAVNSIERVGSPQIVERIITTTETENLMFSVHAHGLFDLPMQAFIDVLANPENGPNFLRRMQELELLCESEGDYCLARQLLSFRFLGFGAEYEQIVHNFITDEVDSAKRYSVMWQLEQSLDGAHDDIFGGWLLQEIIIDEQPHTYLSYVTTTVFAEEPFGLRAALRSFGSRDIRNLMRELAAEAENQATLP